MMIGIIFYKNLRGEKNGRL